MRSSFKMAGRGSCQLLAFFSVAFVVLAPSNAAPYLKTASSSGQQPVPLDHLFRPSQGLIGPLFRQNDHSLHPPTQGGCYYQFRYYDEGDRIITNEPCLNCTCHNSMLMCYLKVCPFSKPIGQDCTVEKSPEMCCPIITCPQVPVNLQVMHMPSTSEASSTTVATTSSSTAVERRTERGCSIDGRFYPDGAQVPGDPHNPCELCYCIRNNSACLMQECTLKVEGCSPVFEEGECCPVRYNCEYDERVEEITTTTMAPNGTLITTTILPPTAVGCIHNDEFYADGSLIPSSNPCEHCYCMKTDLVCAVQECRSPLDEDDEKCKPRLPNPGQCCPEAYDCPEYPETTTILADERISTTDAVEDVTEELVTDATELPVTSSSVETRLGVDEIVETTPVTERAAPPVTDIMQDDVLDEDLTTASPITDLDAVTLSTSRPEETTKSPAIPEELITPTTASDEIIATVPEEIVTRLSPEELITTSSLAPEAPVGTTTEIELTTPTEDSEAVTTLMPEMAIDDEAEIVTTSLPEEQPIDDEAGIVTTSLPEEQPIDDETEIVTTSLPEEQPIDDEAGIATTSIPEEQPIDDEAEIVTTSLPEEQTIDDETEIVTTSLPEEQPIDDEAEIVTTSLPEEQPIDDEAEIVTTSLPDDYTTSYPKEITDDLEISTAEPVVTPAVDVKETTPSTLQEEITSVTSLVADDEVITKRPELAPEDTTSIQVPLEEKDALETEMPTLEDDEQALALTTSAPEDVSIVTDAVEIDLTTPGIDEQIEQDVVTEISDIPQDDDYAVLYPEIEIKDIIATTKEPLSLTTDSDVRIITSTDLPVEDQTEKLEQEQIDEELPEVEVDETTPYSKPIEEDISPEVMPTTQVIEDQTEKDLVSTTTYASIEDITSVPEKETTAILEEVDLPSKLPETSPYPIIPSEEETTTAAAEIPEEMVTSVPSLYDTTTQKDEDEVTEEISELPEIADAKTEATDITEYPEVAELPATTELPKEPTRQETELPTTELPTESPELPFDDTVVEIPEEKDTPVQDISTTELYEEERIASTTEAIISEELTTEQVAESPTTAFILEDDYQSITTTPEPAEIDVRIRDTTVRPEYYTTSKESITEEAQVSTEAVTSTSPVVDSETQTEESVKDTTLSLESLSSYLPPAVTTQKDRFETTDIPVSPKTEYEDVSTTAIPEIDVKMCKADGVEYSDGALVPVSNHCQETCRCDNGTVLCQMQACPSPPPKFLNCTSKKLSGDCCPSIECQIPDYEGIECMSDGIQYLEGELIPSKDICRVCYCHSGEILCDTQECPLISDGCTASERLEGSCCPTKYECAQLEVESMVFVLEDEEAVPADDDEYPEERTTAAPIVPIQVKTETPTETVTSERITTKPDVADVTESHVAQTTESDITEVIIPDVTEPVESDVILTTESGVSEATDVSVTEPTELDVSEPSDVGVTEPTETDVSEPSKVSVTEPTTLDLTEPSDIGATETAEPATVSEPSDVVTESAEPGVSEPSDDFVTEQTEPAISDPSDVGVTEPIEPDVSEPSDIVVTEPAEPHVSTIADVGVTEPIEPVVTTLSTREEIATEKYDDEDDDVTDREEITFEIETTTSIVPAIKDTTIPPEDPEIKVTLLDTTPAVDETTSVPVEEATVYESDITEIAPQPDITVQPQPIDPKTEVVTELSETTVTEEYEETSAKEPEAPATEKFTTTVPEKVEKVTLTPEYDDMLQQEIDITLLEPAEEIDTEIPLEFPTEEPAEAPATEIPADELDTEKTLVTVERQDTTVPYDSELSTISTISAEVVPTDKSYTAEEPAITTPTSIEERRTEIPSTLYPEVASSYLPPKEVTTEEIVLTTTEYAPVQDDAPSLETTEIPGEGQCLTSDGSIFEPGAIVPTFSPCQKECTCNNSVILCQLVECPPPPPECTGEHKCIAKQSSGDCCPSYESEEIDTSTPVADDAETDISEITTDVSVSPEATVVRTELPVTTEIPEETEPLITVPVSLADQVEREDEISTTERIDDIDLKVKTIKPTVMHATTEIPISTEFAEDTTELLETEISTDIFKDTVSIDTAPSTTSDIDADTTLKPYSQEETIPEQPSTTEAEPEVTTLKIVLSHPEETLPEIPQDDEELIEKDLTTQISITPDVVDDISTTESVVKIYPTEAVTISELDIVREETTESIPEIAKDTTSYDEEEASTPKPIVQMFPEEAITDAGITTEIPFETTTYEDVKKETIPEKPVEVIAEEAATITTITADEVQERETTPAKEDEYRITTPAVEDELKITTPAVEDEVRITTPAVEDEVIITTPAVGDEVRETTLAVEDEVRITTPSVEDEVRITTPAIEDEVKITTTAFEDKEIITTHADDESERITTLAVDDVQEIITTPAYDDFELKITTPAIDEDDERIQLPADDEAVSKITTPAIDSVEKMTTPSYDEVEIRATTIPVVEDEERVTPTAVDEVEVDITTLADVDAEDITKAPADIDAEERITTPADVDFDERIVTLADIDAEEGVTTPADVDTEEIITTPAAVDDKIMTTPVDDIDEEEITTPADDVDEERITTPADDVDEERITTPADDIDEVKLTTPADEKAIDRVTTQTPVDDDATEKVTAPAVDIAKENVTTTVIDETEEKITTPTVDEEDTIVTTPASEVLRETVAEETTALPSKPLSHEEPEKDVTTQVVEQEQEIIPPFPPFPGTYLPPHSDRETTTWKPSTTTELVLGPGSCLFDGKVYKSAEQIPRDDPCDFCFCFRGDIICLQQTCPPPIPGCYEEAIPGFCCPRYECPVTKSVVNVTTTTPSPIPGYPPTIKSKRVPMCEIEGVAYPVGAVVKEASSPCHSCRCGADGFMKCLPVECGAQRKIYKYGYR